MQQATAKMQQATAKMQQATAKMQQATAKITCNGHATGPVENEPTITANSTTPIMIAAVVKSISASLT